MKIKEILSEATVGREFPHYEDLLIIDGAEGGLEALDELQDSLKNPSSLRFKWDGGAAIYWGRDSRGRFIFVPKNQWSKIQALDKEGLSYQIRSTGRRKVGQSPEEFAAIRDSMAAKYEELWDLFEAATSEKFRGFLTGDLMFTEPQQINSATNEYEFTPNKVTYHVSPGGLFGKMPGAKAFVVVHGIIKKFGAEATGHLTKVDDKVINQFNQTQQLIVLNSQTPQVKLKSNKEISKAMQFIQTNRKAIDSIANFTAPKFSSLKSILYTFAISRGKVGNNLDFNKWLETSKVSDNQKTILDGLMRTTNWQVFWAAFQQIINAKHDTLEQLHQPHHTGGDDMYNRLGIRSSIGGEPGGEGFVKTFKSGRMGKLVNPKFRSAPMNPRFAPDNI